MSTELLLTAGVSAIVGVMLTLIAVLARAYLRGDSAEAHEDEHEDEADNLRRSIEGLQKRLATHASFEQASRSLKTQYGELAHKYNELVRLHNDLVRRFNEQTKSTKLQAETHKKESTELEKANALLTSSLRDISNRLANLGREKEHLEERCRQAEEELSSRPQVQEPVPAIPVASHDAAIEADLRGQIASLQNEISDLRKQLAGGGTKADRLQQEIAALEGKNLELGGQLARLNSSISGLNTTLAEQRRLLLESEGGRRELELEVIEWQDKYRESTRSGKEAGERNAALEKQFQQLQKSFGEQAQSLRDLGIQLQAAAEGLSASDESVSLAVAEAPPTWLGAKQAIVGLDFGTYSTKIVVRARGDKDSHVVVVDEPTEGYPSSVSPSLVRLTDGKLYFGSQAAKGPREGIFRSLKVSLLPPAARNGWVQDNFPPGTNPDLLVAVYLSWVLGRLSRILGIRGGSVPILNVAAPMDHLEDGAMKERYLHVVNAAWEATFGKYPIRIEQGVGFRQLRPLFEHWLEQEVPDITIRRFEILPETLAPLVSLSQNPRVRPGFYMMVDMGAGTTELSVSHVNEPTAKHRILCYSDSSVFLGGDRFNDNDETNAGQLEHSAAEQHLLDEFLGKANGVWHDGFCKDKDGGPRIRERWKQLNVILSGGGLRRPSVQQAIKSKPPMKMVFLVDDVDYTVDWHRPAGLHLASSASSPDDIDPESLPYFAVAHGLSIERLKWPIWHRPKDVERNQSPADPDDPLDHGYLDW